MKVMRGERSILCGILDGYDSDGFLNHSVRCVLPVRKKRKGANKKTDQEYG